MTTPEHKRQHVRDLLLSWAADMEAAGAPKNIHPLEMIRQLQLTEHGERESGRLLRDGNGAIVGSLSALVHHAVESQRRSTHFSIRDFRPSTTEMQKHLVKLHHHDPAYYAAATDWALSGGRMRATSRRYGGGTLARYKGERFFEAGLALLVEWIYRG